MREHLPTEFRVSWVFGVAAVGLFLLGLVENWLELGLHFAPLSISSNSGLILVSLLFIVPYYVAKRIEARKTTYY
ncbi:hypothetical protein [Salinigranum halophilum]|jgi:hypothetical protein|uniref:hypothetical protein n=1 Tax=Salinigranum halophilum TaxID=2565931 RepID=UPI0010A81C26|nr:hypothetical protein [Salinigranum halophilum]